MNNPTAAWLAALAVNQTVMVEIDGNWVPATVLEIKGDPVTPETAVEVQPQMGRIQDVAASQLRPTTTVKARVVIELDATLGQTTIDQFREILVGNVQAAIDQGLLTVDTDAQVHLQAPGCINEGPAGGASVDSHDVTVTVADNVPLFTSEQRKDVIDNLVDDMVDSLSTSEEYAGQVSRQGHTGYEQFTDVQLREEFYIQRSAELADWFEWAEDGQVDEVSANA